ncbi:MAG: GNAT family N-acetyltransferase [Patescibacteria group bacterium]
MKTDYIIRRADKEDLSTLVELNSDLADFHHQLEPRCCSGQELQVGFKENFIKNINNPDFYWQVIVYKNSVIGYVLVKIDKGSANIKPTQIGVVSGAILKPEHQNQGLMKKAINQALIWLKKQNIEIVELNVLSNNQAAITVWQKLGFVEYKKRMYQRLEK